MFDLYSYSNKESISQRVYSMAASTFIFVFIGVSVVTTKVMNTLLLLDQPKRRRARSAR